MVMMIILITTCTDIYWFSMIFDQWRWVYMSSMDICTWPTKTGIQPASEARWRTRTIALTSRCGRGKRSGSHWKQPVNFVMIPIQRLYYSDKKRLQGTFAVQRVSRDGNNQVWHLFPWWQQMFGIQSPFQSSQCTLGQTGITMKSPWWLCVWGSTNLFHRGNRPCSIHLRNPTMPYHVYIIWLN